MYILNMNINEIESKVEEAEKTLSKMKELIADAKICTSDITKTLIMSAVKKYAAAFSDFKLEG